MKTLTILISLLLSFFIVSGQENLPLKFQGSENKWGSLTWMNNLTDDNQWFDYRVPPIVDADTIYVFMNFRHNVIENGLIFGYSGYTIKKLNKSTGIQYWETQRLYRNYLQRKVISQPQMVDDKLVVTLFDEAKSFGSEWYDCFPAHIVLELKNGVVIDSNYVDKSDITLPQFRSINSSPSITTSNNPWFLKSDIGYIQRSLSAWSNQLGIIDNKLDVFGHIVESDTFEIITPYYLSEFVFHNNEIGGINVCVASEENSWQDKEIKLIKLDANLSLIKSVDITQHFTDTITTFALNTVENGYSLITTSYESPTLRTLQFNFHLFDSDGNLIDKMSYTLRPGLDTGISYGWLYPMIDEVNKRILVTQSRQNKLDEPTFFEVYTRDGDTIQRIKKIEVEGLEDHFRIEYATMMENGDLLLYIGQFAWADPNVRWFSWIMLDGQKMNIISNTKDITIKNNQLKIHPNPTNSIIHIQGLQEEANVRIQNINSQVIKTINTTDGQVDISELPNGLYIFEIQNKHLMERHKVLKIE